MRTGDARRHAKSAEVWQIALPQLHPPNYSPEAALPSGPVSEVYASLASVPPRVVHTSSTIQCDLLSDTNRYSIILI